MEYDVGIMRSGRTSVSDEKGSSQAVEDITFVSSIREITLDMDLAFGLVFGSFAQHFSASTHIVSVKYGASL